MRRNDSRTTVLTAVATFIGLSLLTAVVWAMTRPAPTPATPPQQAQAEPATFERITVEELEPLVAKGAVTVIDVRASEAYLASHVAGSLHIPVGRIEGEIPYLPKGKPVVTYCTCPNEESSGEAALILQKNGIEAKALRGGYEAWTAKGYPTAAGVQ